MSPAGRSSKALASAAKMAVQSREGQLGWIGGSGQQLSNARGRQPDWAWLGDNRADEKLIRLGRIWLSQFDNVLR